MKLPATGDGKVLELRQARDRRQLRAWRARVQGVQNSNKRALGRLFVSGAIYSRRGARAGREMLGTHQKLLELNTLIGRLGDLFDDEDTAAEEVRELVDEIETLYLKTRDEVARSDSLVTSLTGPP